MNVNMTFIQWASFYTQPHISLYPSGHARSIIRCKRGDSSGSDKETTPALSTAALYGSTILAAQYFLTVGSHRLFQRLTWY